MAQKDKNTLKGYFRTGARPTEGQFADLIDSMALEADLSVEFFDSVDTENVLNTDNPTATLNSVDMAAANAPIVMLWRDSRFYAKVTSGANVVFYARFPRSNKFGVIDGKGIAPKAGVLYVSQTTSTVGRTFVQSDSGGWNHLEQVDLDLRLRVISLEGDVSTIPTPQSSVNGTNRNYVYSTGNKSLDSVVAVKYTCLLQNEGRLIFRAHAWNSKEEEGNYFSTPVPKASATADGAMDHSVFSRLGTGASIYESTASSNTVTISYPNWAAGGNRTFILNAATTARAGVMTAAMVNRLTAVENAVEQSTETLSREIAELRQQLYDATRRPQIEAELTSMGWNEQQLDAAFTTNPQMTNEQVELRRNLLGLNYTITEVEECMEDVPALTQANIEYAKQLMTAWNPATTDMTKTYANDTQIVVFPKIDTSNVTKMSKTWLGCVNMRYLPLLDVTAVTYCERLFTEDGNNTRVPLRRLPAFELTAMTGPSNPCCFMRLNELEIIPHMRFKGGANMWNIFNECSKVKQFGGIELDWNTVRQIAQLCSNWKSYDRLPFTNLHKCSGRNIQLFSSLGANLSEPIDLSGETITADAGVDIDLEGMLAWSNLCGLPRLDIPSVGAMNSTFVQPYKCRVVPDYSHLKPTTVERMLCSTKTTNKLERIEGLNFERITSMDHMLSHYNSNGYCPNLRYIRILNLGKSACATYAFYSANQWGSGSAENLQSLVDSLLTNSYDRAAASMATATIKLPSATLARLTEEQKAAITAKGYTLVQL